MKYFSIIIFLVFSLHVFGQEQKIIQGKIIQNNGNPIPGAVLRVNQKNSFSNNQGRFKVLARPGDTIHVTHIGFQNRFIVARQSSDEELNVVLHPFLQMLSEVQVSTGYQRLPKERVTGSFVQLDSSILNRRVSTSLLSRLEDITPGLIFNRSGKTRSNLSIRGQNTINANANALIVIDNFPFEEDINNINPNDVESITILKDAAAASIWGARASNGVIVITTRKGKFEQRPTFSFNSNVTLGTKPDLYYQPRMSVSDFIDTEKKLFSEKYYTNIEASDYHVMLTPVIELLIAAREGKISQTEANAQIEAMKQYDIRKDIDENLNRNSTNQQYSMSMMGGSKTSRFIVSFGYDKNLAGTLGNDYNRLTLNANNSYSFLNKKLELETGIYYTSNRNRSRNDTYVNGYPYATLKNEDGSPAIVTRDYRTGFVAGAHNQGLLNWQYKPLEELEGTNVSKNVNYRLNLGLKYKILPGLSASVSYLYSNNSINNRNLHHADSYFTRDLVNRYTQVSSAGSIERPIPAGGILDLVQGNTWSHNPRGQINFDRNWSDIYEITAIAGAERREQYTLSNAYRLYGYDANRSLSIPVDYVKSYPLYVNSNDFANIQSLESESDLTDRFISYYTNIAYTYKKRYTVSGSARIDKSNIFGVKTNQKGAPLYSAGIAWNISKEDFIPSQLISMLKLRATYGINGNSFTNYYAFTTAGLDNGNSSPTLLPFARIGNPPNPNLRWERTRILNLGIDFGVFKNRLNGSFEYYKKRSTDLLGSTPMASSTGVTSFRGNFGSTKGNGFDLVINSENLEGKIGWQSNFFLSIAKDEIVEYNRSQSVVSGAGILSGSLNTMPGKPFHSLSSYSWAGLNPANGNPRGYLNGIVSEAYAAMIRAATLNNIIYHGYSEPPIYGALRNTLTYKVISLSANVSLRAGYYFRKESVRYSNNYGLGTPGDYELRWKQSGDENSTFVPSIPAVFVSRRDEFYQYAPVLVDKADHVRFQDVKLDYQFASRFVNRLSLKNVHLYAYVNNIGVIWKATKFDVDPDYQIQQPIRTYSFGIKANF